MVRIIDDRPLQLLDKAGFIDAYYEGIRAGLNCTEAFNSVNDEFYMYFGKFKYTDYRSFASVRDYKPKK